jgi:hypothetical protein
MQPLIFWIHCPPRMPDKDVKDWTIFSCAPRLNGAAERPQSLAHLQSHSTCRKRATSVVLSSVATKIGLTFEEVHRIV